MGPLGIEKFIIWKEVKHIPIMDLLNAHQALGTVLGPRTIKAAVTYLQGCARWWVGEWFFFFFLSVTAALTLGDVGGTQHLRVPDVRRQDRSRDTKVEVNHFPGKLKQLLLEVRGWGCIGAWSGEHRSWHVWSQFLGARQHSFMPTALPMAAH